ncbi:MAG: branched-chain amino acid transaminase [Thermoplasmata archaeon]
MVNENLKVWFDGKLMNYSDVRVPVLTHSLQYGSGIFEGIRAYLGNDGVLIFRLRDHIIRFMNTAKIYYMNINYSLEELQLAVIDTVKANGKMDFYIRPFAFYNDDNIGLSPFKKKISVFIAAVPFREYLNEKDGVRIKTSSWRRMNSNILPVKAKASGNYLNSIIAHMEVRTAGYDEALILDEHGYIAEGPGENIFIIKDNTLITPGEESDILQGITRDSIIRISGDLGLNVKERMIHREEIYTADEVFFTGTAAEITSIIEVDNIRIGNGRIGENTRKIKEMYMDIVRGKVAKYNGWLIHV